jgi:glycosyltransferase involved in cell wall biosynthesis
MNSPRLKAAVVVPAYQAAKTLSSVLERIPAAAWERIPRLVIVNDGSTDTTATVARELATSREAVCLVDLPENRGYGGAVKEGLRRALLGDPDVVACLHADGQYAPEELPRLLLALERRGLDILQGSRLARAGALRGGMPLYKLVANRALTFLENRVYGLRLSDYHSGYMLFSRRALQRIRFERLSDSFDFDLEMIACARQAGLAIGEEPIPTHYGDEVSYLRPIPYGLRALRVMGTYLTSGYIASVSSP